MISYDDLCQALDRFNGRRRNAEEMAHLDGADETATPESAHDSDLPEVAAVAASDDAYLAPDADDPEAALMTSAPETPSMDTVVVESDGFSQQPDENTQEIDVDDVVVEDGKPDPA